jgi:NAD-dependent deacetylase sirtuin 2
MDRVISGIKSGAIKNVAFLCGAGVSTSSGIPDFRSAGGLYDTLRPELLTASPSQRQALMDDPTMVVNYALFKENQLPYLEVRRPFILGAIEQRWKATLTHFFMQVVHDKKILKRVYTQNIGNIC